MARPLKGRNKAFVPQSLNLKRGWWCSLTHLIQTLLMLMRSWALRASQTAICQIKKKSKVGVFGILYRTDYCEHEPELPIVPQSIEFFLQIADLGRQSAA